MTVSEIKKSSDLMTGFYWTRFNPSQKLVHQNICQGYFEPILVKNILTFLGGAFVKITKKICRKFFMVTQEFSTVFCLVRFMEQLVTVRHIIRLE